MALDSQGASVVAFSSQWSATYKAGNAIDGNTGNSWESASGQVSDQYLVVQLARGKSHLIERIRLWNLGNTESVREFRIDLSNTTADATEFATVLTATALNNSTSYQDFTLPGGPVPARYVRFVAVNNYGSTSDVGIRELAVVPVAQAPQRSYSAPSMPRAT